MPQDPCSPRSSCPPAPTVALNNGVDMPLLGFGFQETDLDEWERTVRGAPGRVSTMIKPGCGSLAW